MNDYTELRVDLSPCSETFTDIVAAILADAGYESFVADEKGVTAYIPVGQYSAEAVDGALAAFPVEGVTFTLRAVTVPGRDWNSEWEKHYFQPIVVDNRCVIH